MAAEQASLEGRLLILAPTGKDAELARAVLNQAGIDVTVCRQATALVQELKAGAAAVLVAEEAISGDDEALLSAYISEQPPWSDLPVLVLTRQGADSFTVGKVIESLGNVTLLERPTRITALVSSVRTALRARQRQYQMRAYLAERERAADALRESDRRKDEFLATLAHELRNPLAPIRNSLHILRLANGEDPTSERVCEMMERQVNNLVRLVDDLLELSRVSRGKIELRKEAVELAAVVRSAVETSRPLIDAGGHQLMIALPPEPLTLEGDPLRLSQVLSNLLNNAAKYTDEGGQIWLTARQEGGDVVISVRDNGLGIPPEMLPRVFDMFTQIDRSIGRAQGGLGIGLALVRNLVEMHGGSVEVRSPGAGEGSEFLLHLPLLVGRRSPTTACCEPGSAAAPVANRVLVVDDNHDAADSLGMLLRFLGAEVQVVHDGPAALTAMEAFRPAIVLLDIGMPGMDGYEVARRIRQQAAFADVALIALTGWGQEEDRRRTQAAGFNYHLIKPAEIGALQALLASLSSRSG